MNFQFQVAGPNMPQQQPVPTQVSANTAELLRQILEAQKEQNALMRHLIMANDAGLRWRNFLSRWNELYPEMASGCKDVLPHLERAYMDIMNELTERLRDDGDEALDNEFTLGEFLDKYGMKLGQLGQIINLVTPLAEAAPPPQAPASDEASSGEGGS
jgi:hypothetical protein